LRIKCYHCQKDLGAMGLINFSKQYLSELVNGERRPFCDDKCYQEYLKEFYVETYNGKDIYKINVGGQVFYLPYVGCAYGFYTIEGCKARIDDSTIGFIDMNMWGL